LGGGIFLFTLPRIGVGLFLFTLPLFKGEGREGVASPVSPCRVQYQAVNAWMPVCARPRINAWMSCVPS
jgi:hypothetical protein